MTEVTATPEWHFYCPNCGRSCLSRIDFYPGVPWKIMECPDCGSWFKVTPQNSINMEDQKTPTNTASFKSLCETCGSDVCRSPGCKGNKDFVVTVCPDWRSATPSVA